MDRVAARKSPTIMFLVKSSRTGSIPIVEVKSKILEKVLDYCYKHVPVPPPQPTPRLQPRN